MHPLNILVCEDEAIVGLEFKERLERLGHRVVGIASTETEALALAHDFHPDMALMDVKLGSGSRGTHVAEVLYSALDIPSIFVSGYNEPQIVEEAHAAHPLAFLSKPLRDSDLTSAIDFGMARHRMDLTLKRELAAFKKATHIARQLPKASSDELLGKVAKDMQLLSGVIGPIAHHINNSLAVVSGYLSMATASPELEPYERRFVEAALNECQKQKLFVQRLLWASEECPREMRPVALETVVSRAIEEIRTVLRSGIELSLGEIAKELRVYGDQAALTYALEGLLINAIHAISKSGAITVSVRTTFVERTQLRNAQAAPDTYAVVEVQDSGVGVSIEQLEEMCTFFASPAGEPNTEGLGLSVAFGVARAHHGWLELESSPGSGSRIRMLLPVLHTH